MRKLHAIAALLIAFAAFLPSTATANCTTPCTKTQVTTDITANWPDNTLGQITPLLLRSTVLDLVNSYVDANGTTSLTCAASQWVTALPTLSSITCAQPTAAQIVYAPVGTGGVATTDKVLLDRTVWVNDYGAVCDGVTDDHTAFQNAINQGQSAGRPVKFTGTCALNAGLSITGSLDFSGVNGGIYTGQSRIIVTSASVLGITVTTANGNPVYFHDFGMQYSPAANSGVAAITITGTAANENSGSILERLLLNGGIAIGVDFVKASVWTLTNSQITSSVASNTAIRIANGNNADSGDNTIYGNLIQQTGGSGAGITWNSSGGTRIENNKILGITMAQGIQIALASGATTSDIFIVGNSIEGLSTSGISVNLVRSGTTGGLNHIVIGHNELGGGQVCVSVPTDANGTWINNINITGNSCQNVNTSSNIGFNINTAIGIVVSNNNYWATGAGTNQPAIIGANATT